MSKKLTESEKAELELYVEHTTLDLTDQFEQEAVNVAPLLQIVSRKRHSLLNHDNMQHIQLWKHRESGKRYLVVVRQRLKIANTPRIVKELSTLFPGAKKVSLRHKPGKADPDLGLFYHYTEPVIWDLDKKDSILDSLGGLLTVLRVPEQQLRASESSSSEGSGSVGPAGGNHEANLIQEEERTWVEEEMAEGQVRNEEDDACYSLLEGQVDQIEQMEQRESEKSTQVEDCCDIMNDSSMEDELIFIANVDDSLFFSFP